MIAALQFQSCVMARLDRAIQDNEQESFFASLSARRLDGRIKCGHDGEGW